MFFSLLLQIFTLISWNCENLFDCEHDSLHQDEEWLPDSYRHWTPHRYWQKINHIGQTLIACGNSEEGWRLPDLVVLTEVENDSVMVALTRRSLLRSARYEYVMTNNDDPRGIDVAVLYSPFRFRLIDSYSIDIEPVGDKRPLRDILYLSGEIITGDTLHLFALHAPSRRGGERQTRPYRKAVMNRLVAAVDSIRALSADAYVLIAGDFNDYASSPSLLELEKHGLVNISQNAKGSHGAKATYKYRGVWNSLDHIVCTPLLAQWVVNSFIADFPFLLTDDETYGGKQPLRNYHGAKWQNGFSDHLPLVVQFKPIP